jgi:hypothetical protein
LSGIAKTYEKSNTRATKGGNPLGQTNLTIGLLLVELKLEATLLLLKLASKDGGGHKRKDH